MAQVGSVSVHGTNANPKTTAYTIGLGTSLVRSVDPFVGVQPIAGVTIVSVIKMQNNGTRLGEVWLSPSAVAANITALV